MSVSLASSLARLSLRAAQRAPRSALASCAVAVPLASSSSGSVRYASSVPTLGNLKPNIPKKNRRRVGRGPGSGRGGTSGRGMNGQNARAGNGKPSLGFEGGQTPIMKRYPKRGFTNPFSIDYAVLNVDRLQHWIDQGRLDTSKPITARELWESRCVHKVKGGIKVLGNAAQYLRTPINLIVSQASGSAIKAIERAGGSVVTRYYTPLTLRALVKPHKFEGKLLPRDADPTLQKELIYYSDPAHRGYLATRPPPARLPRKPNAPRAYLEKLANGEIPVAKFAKSAALKAATK